MRRYCKHCKKETLHDKTSDNDDLGLFLRGIWAVSSFGFSETISNTFYYKCQKCDSVTER